MPSDKNVTCSRKQIHWATVNKSKLPEDSVWNQNENDSSYQVVGLDTENAEFQSLVTSPVKGSVSPRKAYSEQTKKTVHLIRFDWRQARN